MKLSYDKLTDSLYIHLPDTPSSDFDEVTEGKGIISILSGA
jgi:hypothetical protein